MLSTHGLKYLKGKKTAILGFGREGLSTSKFLKRNGIKYDILDSKFDKNYVEKIKNHKVIFRTPGFPRLHPKLLEVEKNGTLLTSNTKLFFELCPAKIVGVTGTKGKTTTSFLIYEILRKKFGRTVFRTGNFGKPALDILPKLKKNSLVVFELSSFQLQDLDKSPYVAVITNISVDHLDPSGKFGPATHQTANEYFKAKMNILKYQNKSGYAVINPILKNRLGKVGRGKKKYFDILKYQRIFSKPNDVKLRGRHNLENISLAVEVGKIFKVPEEKILKVVKSFKGVEHRLELVKKINGVSFYNDSAATNPDATLAALKSFSEPIHLILGGSDKGLTYRKLSKYILKSRNVKSAALIGQIKNKLYKLIGPKKSKRFKTLKDAVLTLFEKSNKNEIVLLSPGAASFGMFQNYAERGEVFKKLVHKLDKPEVAHARR